MRPFGVAKTPEGLRFAYISGTENAGDEIQFKIEDLKHVEEQFMISSERDEDEGILDVLFTWSWPQETKSSGIRVPESQRLGPLIWNLKPRYIFAPSHDSVQHFERAPYENVDTKTGEFLHPSRFIALASANDASDGNVKKKWIYALNLVPGKFVTPLSLAKRPEDCTSNPFLPISSKSGPRNDGPSSTAPNYFFQVSEVGSKRKFESENPSQWKKPPAGYICKKCHSSDHFYRDCIYKDSNLDSKSTYVCHICHEPGHHIRNCPKRDEQHDKHSKAKTVAPETCWFCLSNPAARKYLIADIGDEVYLALAKGPLTPEHLILVPIEHFSSTLNDFDGSLRNELKQFMKKVNELHEGKRAIFFRISNNPSHHWHMQAISIDSVRISDFLEFLEDFSIKLGYNFKQAQNEVQETFFEFSYISDSGEIIKLVHQYDPSAFFPAQYGRQVLASFLEIEGGADWKNEIYTEDDEKRFVADLKKKLSNKNKN